MTIIQQIRVTWTKKSRGAPGSALRNAVPRALPIVPEDCGFLFEEYDFEEKDGFKQKLANHLVSDQIPSRIHNLVLKHQNDELVVEFGIYHGYRSTNRVDLLLQYPKKRILLRLEKEKYGRIILNARHIEESYHWYSQDIYNIAVVKQPGAEIFISCEPDQIRDLRVKLL